MNDIQRQIIMNCPTLWENLKGGLSFHWCVTQSNFQADYGAQDMLAEAQFASSNNDLNTFDRFLYPEMALNALWIFEYGNVRSVMLD